MTDLKKMQILIQNLSAFCSILVGMADYFLIVATNYNKEEFFSRALYPVPASEVLNDDMGLGSIQPCYILCLAQSLFSFQTCSLLQFTCLLPCVILVVKKVKLHLILTYFTIIFKCVSYIHP